MRRTLSVILALLLITLCAGCGKMPATVKDPELPDAQEEGSKPENDRDNKSEETNVEKRFHLSINDTEVAVDWEDNESVAALAELAVPGPLSVQMSLYGGFEQVGSLGTDLPRNDSQTTTQAGDIVLYAGDQIVIFYGSNSWAYTRLGRITDRSAAEMKGLLGGGDVTVTLWWE